LAREASKWEIISGNHVTGRRHRIEKVFALSDCSRVRAELKWDQDGDQEEFHSSRRDGRDYGAHGWLSPIGRGHAFTTCAHSVLKKHIRRECRGYARLTKMQHQL
jgi:hypothetical protein